jgi:hypothetical protein
MSPSVFFFLFLFFYCFQSSISQHFSQYATTTMANNIKFFRWGVNFTNEAIEEFRSAAAAGPSSPSSSDDEGQDAVGEEPPSSPRAEETFFHDILLLKLELSDALTALSIEQECVFSPFFLFLCWT